MYDNLFRINSPLASNSNADLGDTLKTKKALNKMGYMAVPSYGIDEYPDEPMFSGIKKFQKAKGLKVDGVMNPGGETERTIAKALAGGVKSILPRRKDKEEERREKAEELEKKFSWPDTSIPRDWPLPDGSYPQPKPKPKPKPGIPDIMLPYLGQAVGIGGKNKANDVAAAKVMLKQAGFLSNPKTSESDADPDFKFDIQRFQTANGLKMDGVMNPGGETEKALGASMQPQDSSSEVGDGEHQNVNAVDEYHCKNLKKELDSALALHDTLKQNSVTLGEEVESWKTILKARIDAEVADPNSDVETGALFEALSVMGAAAGALIVGAKKVGVVIQLHPLVATVLATVTVISTAVTLYNLLNPSDQERFEMCKKNAANVKVKIQTGLNRIAELEKAMADNGCTIEV